MNKKFLLIEQALGPTSGVPPVDNFPQSYVPEDCGECEHEDKLPGGLADENHPYDFDPNELAMGIEVEKEHTHDEALAKEIAMDHLKEIPDYYTRLKKMEDEAGGGHHEAHHEQVIGLQQNGPVAGTTGAGLDDEDRTKLEHWSTNLHNAEARTYEFLEDIVQLKEEYDQIVRENTDIYLDFEDYIQILEHDQEFELNLLTERKVVKVKNIKKKLKKYADKLSKMNNRSTYSDLESAKTKWVKYGIGSLIGADMTLALTRAALSKDKKTKAIHIGSAATQKVAGISGSLAGTALATGVAGTASYAVTGMLIAQLPVGIIYTWWFRKENDKCNKKCKGKEGYTVCYNTCYNRAAGALISKAKKDLQQIRAEIDKSKDHKRIKSLSKLQHKINKQIAFYRKKQEGYKKAIAKAKTKKK
jgi:hypothetical protein